jgi:hypothetical protein
MGCSVRRRRRRRRRKRRRSKPILKSTSLILKK